MKGFRTARSTVHSNLETKAMSGPGRKRTRKQPKSAAAGVAALPRVPKTDFAKSAHAALEATKTVSVLETKDGSSRKIVYDPVVLKALRAMFPGGKEYKFRLAATVIPYPTDGSGNILAALSFSPAVSSFPEWSGFAALFDEVNLIKARATFVGGASGNKAIGLVFGYNPNNVSSTPASTTAVTNLNNSNMVLSYSTTPRLLVMSASIPRDRTWAETTVPAVASPPSGCVGTIDIANGGASGTVSVNYIYSFLEIEVKLRNRI